MSWTFLLSKTESKASEERDIRFWTVYSPLDTGVDIDVFRQGADDPSKSESRMGIGLDIRITVHSYIGDQSHTLRHLKFRCKRRTPDIPFVGILIDL